VNFSCRCCAWGGENLQHILKRCVQDSVSWSDAFSPLSIQSDLGISVLHVAHSRLADILDGIRKSTAGAVWPAATALEIAWCLLDGVSSAADSCARSLASSRRSAEALIHFCCRHPPPVLQRLQSLIPALISHHKLLSEDVRVSLCAAFVPWCDHELSFAILDFRVLQPEHSHMRVLWNAAAMNSAIGPHIASHLSMLLLRSPRSLFLTAFALSVSSCDAISKCMNLGAVRGSCQPHRAPSALYQVSPNLAIACKVQGAKRRAHGPRLMGKGDNGRSVGGGAHDDAHELRCSYVSSLLKGLHTEISCVRSYIFTNGNAFELLPLLHWLHIAEAIKVVDSNQRIGLGQLESIVRAFMGGESTQSTETGHASACSLLEAIVLVASSSAHGIDNEKSVSIMPTWNVFN
jgi:hypothetical protein